MGFLSRLMGHQDAMTPRRQGSRLLMTELEMRDVPSATPTVDLTTRGSSGEINGAVFTQYDAQPTGTGVINSFVRLQSKGNASTAQGYNTDARPLAYDENKSPQFTRSLKVSDLPTVVKDGVAYKEFLLDINQKASSPLLSLDQLKIFVGGANISGALVNGQLAGLAPIYDMDAGGDKWVKMNYRLNSGSGSGDMLLYVRADLFTGGENVYLYSKFGENFATNAGFEEWAVGTRGQAVTPGVGTVSGTVYNAMNGDTLSGWLVFIDSNNNNVFDASEVFTYSNAFGQYEFANLTGNTTYNIQISLQPNWMADGAPDEYFLYLNPGDNLTQKDFFLSPMGE